MKDGLTVRPAEIGDQEYYIRLNMAFMYEVRETHPYWESLELPSWYQLRQAFREALTVPEQIMIVVAEAYGEVIGYANTWTVYSIWSMGKALTIDDLYVIPQYRGQGVGKEIMTHLEYLARKNCYRRIQFHAETDNVKAHAFYRRLGYDEKEMLFFMKKI